MPGVLATARLVVVVSLSAAIAACGHAAGDAGGAGAPARAAATTSPPASASGASASPPSEPAPAANGIDEAQFCALGDAVATKLEAAVDAATKNNVHEQEAEALLQRLTPAGVRADMTQAVLDSGLRPEAVAAFIREQHAAAVRCSERMAERMGVLAKRVEALVHKTTEPLVAWRSDVARARADAKRDKKRALVVFCAYWASACKDLEERTFRDPKVGSALHDVVAIRVDATDDEAPAISGLKNEYEVKSVPTLVLYDAKGRETKRFSQAVPPDVLLAALGK